MGYGLGDSLDLAHLADDLSVFNISCFTDLASLARITMSTLDSHVSAFVQLPFGF